jgi:nucleoside-diphosphate-sugar epimerase
MGTMMDKVGHLLGWEPPFTAGVAREYSHRYPNFDTTNTQQTFRYQPTPFEETIRDTVSWFHFLNMGRLDKSRVSSFQAESDWRK